MTRYGKPRLGVIVPLVAILLPVLLILLGFSVDLAHMQKTRSELRLATDSAARSAATVLSRTDSTAQARAAAKQIALANPVAGRGLSLEDSDIEFGKANRNWSGKFVFSAGSSPPNAVRIAGSRLESSQDGAVGLFFGAFIGQEDFEPQFTAVGSFVNVDICLVLDRSSSMKLRSDSSEHGMYTSDPRFCRSPDFDSRWIALDSAVRVFTQILRQTNSEERVAIATYSSDVTGDPIIALCQPPRTTLASTLDESLTSSMDTIDAELTSLTSSLWNGNTNIEAGVRTGLQELRDNGRYTALKKMIVLTDGHENVGDVSIAARECADEGVQIHAITFGDFADQDAMGEVARIGGGLFQHASDPDDLVKAFRKLAGEIARLTE